MADAVIAELTTSGTTSDPKSWSVRMRRASLPLPAADADLLGDELRPLLKPYRDAVDTYRWPREAS